MFLLARQALCQLSYIPNLFGELAPLALRSNVVGRIRTSTGSALNAVPLPLGYGDQLFGDVAIWRFTHHQIAKSPNSECRR